MIEIIVFALLLFIGIQEFFNRKERQKMIEALIARSLNEIKDIEITRKTKPIEDERPAEFVLEQELDDKSFFKNIKKINEIKENE